MPLIGGLFTFLIVNLNGKYITNLHRKWHGLTEPKGIHPQKYKNYHEYIKIDKLVMADIA